MKKILLSLCFFVFYLFANVQETDFQSQIQENQIYTLVQKYVDLNAKIREFKKNNDSNSSSYKSNIDGFESQKKQILTQIPKLIVTQKFDQNTIKAFLKRKSDLELLQKKSVNKNFTYVETSLDLAYLNLVESFYAGLSDLEKLFKDVADSKDMIKLIDQTTDALLNDVNVDLDAYKTKITNALELEQISQKEEQLSNTFDSYNEILKYLKNNADLLESNYLFSVFKLQVWIDKINDFIKIDFLNSGKIFISVLVVIFFMSLRKFSSHLLYFLLINLIYSDKTSANLKQVFIENIKKPMGYFLLVYGLSVCITIIFYPQPVPLNITNFIYIVYAIFIAWLVFGILDGYGIVFISKLAQKSGKREVVNLVIKILYFVIIIIALLFILSRLGFNVSALIASLGIGGLAVALAAKDIIANFFASILLLFDDSFNQGDWVELAGVEGTVVETGLRKTTIRTFDNSLVFLPNSAIMAANIKNWSKRKIGRHLKIYLGVGYDASPEKLEACMKELREFLDSSPLVAHEEDSALKYSVGTAKYRQNLVSINDLEGYKHSCYVSLSDFGDSSINIELYFYTKAVNSSEFRAAKSELMLEFMRIVARNGLSFAFPSRSIYIENLEQSLKAFKEDVK